MNNSPIQFNDPTGHRCEPGDYKPGGYCWSPPSGGGGNGGGGGGAGGNELDDEFEEPTVVVFCGSHASNEPGLSITDPGPLCEEQLPEWDWNPWDYDMEYIQYPGSKYQQAQNALQVDIGGSTILVCYSSGTESCLMYAKERVGAGYDVPMIILMGPTFVAANTPGGQPIRAGSWYDYMSYLIESGTSINVIDDGPPQNTMGDLVATRYDPPDRASGSYQVISAAPFIHHDGPGYIPMGINNNPYAVAQIWNCSITPANCQVP